MSIWKKVLIGLVSIAAVAGGASLAVATHTSQSETHTVPYAIGTITGTYTFEDSDELPHETITVTVTETEPPPTTTTTPPPSTGEKLEWSPPADYESYRVEHITSTHSGNVSGSGDVLVKFDAPLLNKTLVLGASLRNVVIIGGEVKATSGNITCLRSYGGGGTRFIEGFSCNGPTIVDCMALQGATPQRVVIQNTWCGPAQNNSAHPDVLQTQGAKVDSLYIDKLTGVTNLQGIFLKNENGIVAGSYIHDVQLNRINIDTVPNTNNDHLLWQETADIGPVNLNQFYIRSQDNRPFGLDVWPQSDGYGMGTSGRKAVLAADGKSLTFINTNISGTVFDGIPPDGNFVNDETVGMNYVSPGYQ